MKIKLKKDVKPFLINWGGKIWRIPKIDDIPEELYNEKNVKNKVTKVKEKEIKDGS